MSELRGTIKKVLTTELGKTKEGKDWQKQLFVVANNDGYEGKEAIYCFEIFGEEKVQNFNKFNKEGDLVDVSYNISTNEWNGKYYTSLQSWKVFKADAVQSPQPAQPAQQLPTQEEEESDDVPF
jgi:hypothetical protein